MTRTPEDRSPCSRSYWISRVASSCAGRAGEAGPEHTHLDLPPFLPTPHGHTFLGLPTPKVSSLLLRAHGSPITTHWRSSPTQIPWSHTDHGDPHHQGGDKEDGGRGPTVDQAMEGVEEVNPGDTPQQDAQGL